MPRVRNYVDLVKPGIVLGNAVPAAAGFFLASAGAPDLARFFFMLVGLSLVIGAACVFNNYFDRDIDTHMERTKERAFAKREVAVVPALFFGAFLGAVGAYMLFAFADPLSAYAALFGFALYVFFYTPMKPRTHYAVYVGALAGAVPPVVGYVAAAHAFDFGAFILFLMLFFWQMPHFFAIALRRADEYRAAKVPTFPSVRSPREARVHTLLYILAFAASAALLFAAGYAGAWYLGLSLALCAFWLIAAYRSFAAPEEKQWARRAFVASLIVLLGVSAGMALDPAVPQPSIPLFISSALR